jgi:hypothetical protein
VHGQTIVDEHLANGCIDDEDEDRDGSGAHRA